MLFPSIKIVPGVRVRGCVVVVVLRVVVLRVVDCALSWSTVLGRDRLCLVVVVLRVVLLRVVDCAWACSWLYLAWVPR